jgi:outer membrane protein assembly factor BamB
VLAAVATLGAGCLGIGEREELDGSVPEPSASLPTYRADAGRTASAATRGPPGPLEPRWRLPLEGSSTLDSGPPALHDGVLYVNERGSLAAVDAADGSVRWRRRTAPESGTLDGGGGPPTVAGGQVVVTSESALKAFELDGTTNWSLAGFFDGSPAVVDGLVLADAGSELVAVEAADGRVRWRFSDAPTDPELAASLVSTVTAGDGAAYVVARDRAPEPAVTRLYAIELADGSVRWRRRVGPGYSHAPAVAGGAVHLVTTLEGEATLVAVSTADGSVRWRLPLGARTAAPPAVRDGDGAYAGSDDGVRAVETDGRVRWHVEEGDPEDEWREIDLPFIEAGAPFAASDAVYAPAHIDESNVTYAFDPATGERRRLEFSAERPVFADGLAFDVREGPPFGGPDQVLTAFGPA